MPVAGEEGYETLLICPYNRAHEVRQGRMQFHLDKCRKEQHDLGEMIQCPFNSTHTIPKVEEQYHTEEECTSKGSWFRYTHQVGDPNCPVKDLVPVNAATVPDGGENWDDFEAQGSVLNTIKEEASQKKIFRMLQCESKSKRKEFRNQEKLRHSAMEHMHFEDVPVSTSSDNAPLRRPTKASTILVTRQDPQEAVAKLTNQFRSLDMALKPSTSTASATSSMYNVPPSTFCSSSVTPTVSRCESSLSVASTLVSQPSTAMSSALASSNRPRTRPSTASNIEASSIKSQSKNEDVFCQVPIPGLGRGARRKV